MASTMPDLLLPSRSQSIAAHWPVPNCTAWWRAHGCYQLAQSRCMTVCQLGVEPRLSITEQDKLAPHISKLALAQQSTARTNVTVAPKKSQYCLAPKRPALKWRCSFVPAPKCPVAQMVSAQTAAPNRCRPNGSAHMSWTVSITSPTR